MNKGVGRPSPAETQHRRNLVKAMLLDEGITNREEIKRLLKERHGIEVRRQTIYLDVKNIANLHPEAVAEFQLDLLAIYRKQIRDQEDEISRCNDLKTKSYLRRTLSSMMKDMGIVSDSLTVSKTSRWRDKGRKKEKKVEEVTKIVFGESKVVE